MPFTLASLHPRNILAPVIDAVFPARCAACGHRGVWVCDECRPKITLIAPPWCARCGVPSDSECRCHELSAAIDVSRSVAVYSGWMRRAIHLMKYENEPARVPSLANMMVVPVQTIPDFDALVPMPLHPSRLRRRGYNQAELLSIALAASLGRPVNMCLVRTRATKQQVGLHADQRRENVRGAFAATPIAEIAGKRLLLIDDVTTTGSTLNACADALKAAGAAWVGTLTLAREI